MLSKSAWMISTQHQLNLADNTQMLHVDPGSRKLTDRIR